MSSMEIGVASGFRRLFWAKALYKRCFAYETALDIKLRFYKCCQPCFYIIYS